MVEKPRLVLHIGTEKTGTTFIQNFLAENRDALADQGFYTPRSLDAGGGNHRWMPICCYDDAWEDDLVTQQQFISGADRNSKVNDKLKELRAEVQPHSDSHSTWIISSEHLQSRLQSERNMQRLRDITESLFGQIEILLYIRRPILTAISLWSTMVTNGATNKDLPPPDNSYIRWICDHRSTIERWQRHFDNARIGVRIFDADSLVGGSLAADFCQATGIQRHDTLAHPQTHNQALSHRGIQYLSYLNHAIEQSRGNPDTASRWDLANLIAQQTSSFPKYRPMPEEISAYEEFFAESCDWVLAHHFPDREVLWQTPLNVDLDADRSDRQLAVTEIALLNVLWESWSGLPMPNAA